jgi:hypothetical protein
MAITKQRLHSQDASTIVRNDRDAADSPASGDWTPDNLNADEISGGVVADDVILDAREWSSVRLMVDFEDAAGDPASGTSVDITPLIGVPQANQATGRFWKELTAVTTLTAAQAIEVDVHAHDCAFRITAVTLGGADHFKLRVTGGVRSEAYYK